MPPRRGASATPGPKAVRNTRPALNNGINSSYGSRGVADLGAQMTTGRAQETYSHFQRVTRANSVRPEPTPMVEETTTTTASPSPRPDTAILPGAGYDASQLLRQPIVPPRPDSAASVASAASAESVERVVEREPGRAESPGKFAIFVHFLPRYLPRLLQDTEQTILQMAISLAITFFLMACVFIACINLAVLAPLPRTLTLRRNFIIRGVQLASGPIEVLNLPENITAPPSQPEYNRLIYWRTEDMIKATKSLQSQVGFHNESIAELRRLLPDNLAVQKDENGTYLIPEPFWKALLDKIGNDGAAPLWDSFIAANEDKLNAKVHDVTLRGKSQDAIHSISRFEFESTLAANNKMHEDDLRLQFNTFKELVMHEAQKMVEDGAATTLRKAQDILAESVSYKISTQQISALSLTNLVYNSHRVMTEVNHFSPGMGAVVDPAYTSNTASPNDKSWFGYFYMRLVEASVTPNPPVNALTGWDEGTQCWCAAHGSGEYANAQLTVRMAHKISPSSIIIEHIPPKGSRDIAAAPRRLQVWAQLSNKTEAVRVQKRMMENFNYASYHHHLCGKSPRGEKNWVCIMSGEYDIHGNNNVKELAAHGAGIVETEKIAVRVTENWGAKDHTCLYRVRVIGEEVGEVSKEDVLPPLYRDFGDDAKGWK